MATFNYKLDNFIQVPTTSDNRIRLYDKYDNFQYNVTPNLSYFYYKNNYVIIKQEDDVDLNLDFETSAIAIQALQKLNTIKKELIQNIYVEYYTKVQLEDGVLDDRYITLSGSTGITGDLVPIVDGIYSLGSTGRQWKDIWVSGGTIYLDQIPLSISGSNFLFSGETLASQDWVETYVSLSSITNLQNSYNNSTPTPEILTDSTRGSVDFRVGSGSDFDNVVTFQSSATTINGYVKGSGEAFFISLSSSTINSTTISAQTFHGNLDWSDIISTPTTISGYSITDAYTETQVDNNFLSANTSLVGGLDTEIQFNNSGLLTGSSNLTFDGTKIYNKDYILFSDEAVHIGEYSFSGLTTGIKNTCLGYKSGMLIKEGTSNTFIGHEAGSMIGATTDDKQNVAIGNNCCRYVTSGQRNVFIGNNNAQKANIYNRNVSVGSGGFSTSITGLTFEDNVIIGYNVCKDAVSSYSDKLLIHNIDCLPGNGIALIDGDFSTKSLTINGDLHLNQAIYKNVTTISGDITGYTLLTTDDIVLVNSNTAITFVIPTAQMITGRTFSIIGKSAGTHTKITISPEGSETIDGSTTHKLEAAYNRRTLSTDGYEWFQIA